MCEMTIIINSIRDYEKKEEEYLPAHAVVVDGKIRIEFDEASTEQILLRVAGEFLTERPKMKSVTVNVPPVEGKISTISESRKQFKYTHEMSNLIGSCATPDEAVTGFHARWPEVTVTDYKIRQKWYYMTRGERAPWTTKLQTTALQNPAQK